MINGENHRSGVLLLVGLEEREFTSNIKSKLARVGVSCVTFYDLPELDPNSSYFTQCAQQVTETSNLGVILSRGCRPEVCESVILSTGLLHL